ncbi:aminopeptidase-like protein 5, partial [Sarcoptes scabiei]
NDEKISHHEERSITTPSPSESPQTENPIPNENDLRLSANIKPIHYDLTIAIDPNQIRFNGTVRIKLFLDEKIPIRQISMHCKNLKLLKYAIDKMEILDLEYDTIKEMCIFNLKSEHKLNRSIESDFYIEYSGEFVPGQIYGLYRSEYRTIQNQPKLLVATKFEPTYARMAFPCFDEPRFKSTFRISIIHPKHFIALSNERENQTVPMDSDSLRTDFFLTAPMSTYIVALVVCDFQYRESRTVSGTRVRVFSRPDQIEKTQFALDSAAKLLAYYENLFKINYKLSKLDLIGLPQFVSGAMENWGLITYREKFILSDTNKFSVRDLQKIASVIAHELSHMWFGNLVTIDWWNDLWCQEGTASYIEYLGQDKLNSSWHVWDRFAIDDLQTAFISDSLANSHPLAPKKKEVLTADQSTAIFDGITYSKGAAILRYIESIIGREKFMGCLQRYLSDNQMRTITSETYLKYFNDEIKDKIGIDGDIFLKHWIFEAGFPVVTVGLEGNTLLLKQSSFVFSSKPQEPWHIYLTYKRSDGTSSAVHLNETAMKLNIEMQPNEWIKFNRDGRGYYLTNYHPNLWRLLIEAIKIDLHRFSVEDRANLLFDASMLADANLLSYEYLFAMLDYLKQENHYLPFTVASNIILGLERRLSGLQSIQFRKHILRLISKAYDNNNSSKLIDQFSL